MEKVFISEVRFAIRKEKVGENEDYVLSINLGMSEYRWDADAMDRFIGVYKKCLDEGEVIHFPTPHAYK